MEDARTKLTEQVQPFGKEKLMKTGQSKIYYWVRVATCLKKRVNVAVLLLSLLVIAALSSERETVCLADGLKSPLNDTPILLPNHDYTKFKLIPPLTVTLPYLLPPMYDLRTVGRAAPARDELGCASCWSSAATYVMESLVMPDEEWDFSESHMQLIGNGECGGGASGWQAAGYLTAWRGPVAEGDYNDHDYLKIRERTHVQGVTYLPMRRHSLDNNWIKYWVYHNGALYASVGMRGITNTENNSYYWPGNSAVHAVAIVGWDDNFSRDKFTFTNQGTTYAPPGDGAFIVKNNAGPDFGENGFYYISYYDGTIGYNPVVGFTVEPVSNYKRIYQHDPVGTNSVVSRTSIPGYIPEIHGSLQNIGANVFTAVESEELAAIGIPVQPYTYAYKNLEYRIEIHLDPGTTPVNPNGPELSFKTKIEAFRYYMPKLGYQAMGDYGGYYTIPLPQKVQIEAGQKYSVIISGLHGTDTVFLPVEYKRNNSRYSSEPGQSFFSADGLNWYDLTELLGYNSETHERDIENAYGNLGIKAYSIDTSDDQFSVKKSRPFRHVQNTIEIINENMRPMKIRPVFRQKVSGSKRSEVAYIDDSGSMLKNKDEWLEVGPLETVKVVVPYNLNAKAGKRAFKIDWLDWDNNIQFFRKYRYVDKLTLLPLRLLSTDPGANTTVPPGLSVITAVFDKEIKPGPGFMQISLKSQGEENNIYSSVSGKELYITPSGPLSTPDLGGKQWTVTLPADGVTDIHGTPLEQATSWTFTVLGVN
jgi:C1A family cysteine protease